MGRRRTGANQSTGERGERFGTGSVTSEDGTLIGYRELGRGPGVVLLHGTMSSGQNHFDLAKALADAFTAYMPHAAGVVSAARSARNSASTRRSEEVDVLLQRRALSPTLPYDFRSSFRRAAGWRGAGPSTPKASCSAAARVPRT